MKKIALKNAARGTAFDYAGQSWILLENDDGRALCLSKDIIETRAFDEGNCNNFAVASSKEYLNGAYLDNLLEDVNGQRRQGHALFGPAEIPGVHRHRLGPTEAHGNHHQQAEPVDVPQRVQAQPPGPLGSGVPQSQRRQPVARFMHRQAQKHRHQP